MKKNKKVYRKLNFANKTNFGKRKTDFMLNYAN